MGLLPNFLILPIIFMNYGVLLSQGMQRVYLEKTQIFQTTVKLNGRGLHE